MRVICERLHPASSGFIWVSGALQRKLPRPGAPYLSDAQELLHGLIRGHLKVTIVISRNHDSEILRTQNRFHNL
jgi:hypothetical protein